MESEKVNSTSDGMFSAVEENKQDQGDAQEIGPDLPPEFDDVANSKMGGD